MIVLYVKHEYGDPSDIAYELVKLADRLEVAVESKVSNNYGEKAIMRAEPDLNKDIPARAKRVYASWHNSITVQNYPKD